MYTVRMTARQFTEFIEDQAARKAARYLEDTGNTIEDGDDFSVQLYIELGTMFGGDLEDYEDPNVCFRTAVENGCATAMRRWRNG